MLNNFISCLKKCLDFSGRATRSEFWSFILVLFLLNLLLGWIAGVKISVLLFILLTLAVTVRRLNDIKKPTWLAVLDCIPGIGWIILAFFCAQPSKR